MLQPQSQHYSNASCMSSTPVQSQKPVHVNHSSPTRMSNRECQNNNTQPGIMHARVICNKPVRVALRERIDLELVRSGITLRGLRVATSPASRSSDPSSRNHPPRSQSCDIAVAENDHCDVRALVQPRHRIVQRRTGSQYTNTQAASLLVHRAP